MPAFLLVNLFVNPIGSNRFQINLGLHMKIGDADNMAIQVLCNSMGVGCVRISKDQYSVLLLWLLLLLFIKYAFKRTLYIDK